MAVSIGTVGKAAAGLGAAVISGIVAIRRGWKLDLDLIVDM